MPCDAGTRFGPYNLESLPGAGGMGEVYRARDTRLDRIVARGHDVSSDGERLLMVQPQAPDPVRPSDIVLVQNWFDELVRRAPVN